MRLTHSWACLTLLQEHWFWKNRWPSPWERWARSLLARDPAGRRCQRQRVRTGGRDRVSAPKAPRLSPHCPAVADLSRGQAAEVGSSLAANTCAALLPCRELMGHLLTGCTCPWPTGHSLEVRALTTAASQGGGGGRCGFPYSKQHTGIGVGEQRGQGGVGILPQTPAHPWT